MEEKKINLYQRFLHHNMAIVGGFLGAYAVFFRNDFLGNAQTANLIFFVFAILGRNPKEVALRAGGLGLFVGAILLYVYIEKKLKKDSRIFALVFDLAAIICLGLMPVKMDPVLALYPIFFAMPFQWNAFASVYGYSSATIFSSNNVRQATLALGEYLLEKDKKHLHKMVFFLGSLIGFYLGVGLGYVGATRLGIKSIFVALIFLLWASVLLVLCRKNEEKKFKKAGIS